MSLQLMIPRACVFLPDIHRRKVCLFHFNKGVNLLVAVPSPQRFTWGGGGGGGELGTCLVCQRSKHSGSIFLMRMLTDSLHLKEITMNL